MKVLQADLKNLNAGLEDDGRRIPTPRIKRYKQGDHVVEYTPVDLGSPHAGYQILTGFKRAVRKARAENKALLGSEDGLPKTG